MERRIHLNNPELWIPIHMGHPHRRMDIWMDGEKLCELMVPDRSCGQNIQERKCSEQKDERPDYYGKISLPAAEGKEISLGGEVSAELLQDIRTDEMRTEEGREKRPAFHFTALYGWINDPNGLVYKDGQYHYYFQYNPFDIQWQNMCWGHAVSCDLLHWKQVETVLWPDKDGMSFSGCALKNERGMLNLPEDAILYFYTVSAGSLQTGNSYIQKTAYSINGGFTLHPMKQTVGTLAPENRDPKVFWHEESQAYVMILWVESNTFAILRSKDLSRFEESQYLVLEDGFECPDLFYLSSERGGKWIVMTAAGHYYPGSFDGFRFVPDGYKGELYLGEMQYAGQTYSGIADRCIMIPWLKIKYRGRRYRGASGLPRELEGVYEPDGTFRVHQKPVREYELLRQEINTGIGACEAELELEENSYFTILAGGISIAYDCRNMTLDIEGEYMKIPKRCRKLRFFVDDTILEISVDDGYLFAAAELKKTSDGFRLTANSKVKTVKYFTLIDRNREQNKNDFR